MSRVVPRSSHRGLSPTRRGYTLVELGVVTLLTAVLVFGMVRWLTGVGALARTGIDDAADGRRSALAAQISRDLEAAVHCDANGLDARVRELGSGVFSVAAQADDDAAIEVVGWRLNGDVLERGEAELDASCDGEPSGWAAWASGVESFSVAVVVDGALVPTGTGGSCESSLLERCRVDAVAVDVALVGDAATESFVVTLP